jgi:hypothetical protein
MTTRDQDNETVVSSRPCHGSQEDRMNGSGRVVSWRMLANIVRYHRFIPATTNGPPTLLQGDGARGPYRYSVWGGGCDGLVAGGGGRVVVDGCWVCCVCGR